MLIDSHCHLTTEDFSDDLSEVISRAVSAGVGKIINIGTDIETSKKCVKDAGKFGELYATVGLHPEEALEDENSDLKDIYNKLKEIAANDKVVAIGEIGLDYRWIEYVIESKNIKNPHKYADSAIRKQRNVLESQLELALELNLPVVIHSREAETDLFELLKSFTENGGEGVLHSFTGDLGFMQYFVQRGWCVSYNGIITFKNADNVRLLCEKTPLESILLETDAPFLSPVPYRGKRCEPAFLVETLKKLSEIKGFDEEELENLIEENTYKLFKKLG